MSFSDSVSSSVKCPIMPHTCIVIEIESHDCTWHIECLKTGADSHTQTHTYTHIHMYTRIHTCMDIHIGIDFRFETWLAKKEARRSLFTIEEQKKKDSS